MGMSENETHVESTHFNTSRVQTVCDNERYGVQGAGYVIGVDTLNPAVSTGTAKRKSGVQCGLWSAGATRWDSENFEVLVDNVDCVGLGFLMDNSDSGDSGSLTGMRCAVVSRSPGIILTKAKRKGLPIQKALALCGPRCSHRAALPDSQRP